MPTLPPHSSPVWAPGMVLEGPQSGLVPALQYGDRGSPASNPRPQTEGTPAEFPQGPGGSEQGSGRQTRTLVWAAILIDWGTGMDAASRPSLHVLRVWRDTFP